MKREEPSNIVIDSFQELKQRIFDVNSFQVTEPEPEKESQAYDACRFEINQLKVVYRSAKITPTKIGQFVTLWKRISNGPIQPYDCEDHIDLVLINAQAGHNLGQFVFPKSVLLEKGIFSTGTKEGKRGFRVYPPWDKTMSAQAIRTQTWQLPYFLSNSEPIDINRMKMLYLQV